MTRSAWVLCFAGIWAWHEQCRGYRSEYRFFRNHGMQRVEHAGMWRARKQMLMLMGLWPLVTP